MIEKLKSRDEIADEIQSIYRVRSGNYLTDKVANDGVLATIIDKMNEIIEKLNNI